MIKQESAIRQPRFVNKTAILEGSHVVDALLGAMGAAVISSAQRCALESTDLTM